MPARLKKKPVKSKARRSRSPNGTPRIDPEFQALIPPLSADEAARLERSLLAEGCRDPLLVWQEEGVLLDGHNRLALCRRHHLSYQVKTIALPDREAARAFLVGNQLARRNLTAEAVSYLRGARYRVCKQQGKALGPVDAAAGPASGHNDQKRTTALLLAAEYQVGEKTIRRDGRFAGAVDRIAAACGAEAKRLILSRDAQLTHKDVAELAALRDADALRRRFEELRQRGRPRRGPAAASRPARMSVPAEPNTLAPVLVQRLGLERAAALCHALAAELRDHGLTVAFRPGPVCGEAEKVDGADGYQ